MRSTLKAATAGALLLPSLALLPTSAAAQSAFTHVHLRVPDTTAAAAWYQELLGGELREGGPGPSIRFANGFIGTMANEGTAAPSRGSVIDHFAIAVADVDEALVRARRLGAVVAVERQAGNARAATFEDPWGTRVELIEEPGPARVHHVHLAVSNSDDVRDWFLAVFGGELDAEPGRDEAHRIHYGDLAVYVSEARDPARAPSRGRALDHMGFRIDATLPAFEETIEETGYSPYLVRPNPPGSDLMFFEGPGGIHFEIAERAAR
jgi:catechol 2,3-dioxygenase-like lactoylglutathione lyase family enzyme